MDGFKERLSDAITDVCGTQSELARRIGVAPSTVSEWCRTNKYPSTFSLMLMCDELKVSADWLLFGYSDKEIIEDNKSLYETNKRIIKACLEAREEIENINEVVHDGTNHYYKDCVETKKEVLAILDKLISEEGAILKE